MLTLDLLVLTDQRGRRLREERPLSVSAGRLA